jgi:hypothetical protein
MCFGDAGHAVKRKWILAAFAILVASRASAGDRAFDIYFGGGLERSLIKITNSGTESNVGAWGAIGEVGVDIPLSGAFGFTASGLAGVTDGVNSSSSASYIETATLTSYGAQAGFYYGMFDLCGGYRMGDLTVNNVSTGSTVVQTLSTGSTSFGSMGLSFESGAHVRTRIEIQYHTGSFGNLTYQEGLIALQVFFLPF